MRKVPPWLLLMCLAAVLGRALANGQSRTSQIGNPNGNQTISGCLGRSGGNYILTDAQSGTVYTLTGNTDQLGAHVGHEVEITGQPGQSGTTNTNSNPGSATASSAGQVAFQVSGIEHLSDHCGSVANGPGASNDAGAVKGSTNPNAGSTTNAAQTPAGMATPPGMGAPADTNAANGIASPSPSGSTTNTETPGISSSPAAANTATGTQAAAASAPSQENPGSSAGASPGSVPAYGQPATPQGNWSAPSTSGGTDVAQNSYAPSTPADLKKAIRATQGNDAGTGQSGTTSRDREAAHESKASMPNSGSDVPLLGLLGFASTLAGVYLRK